MAGEPQWVVILFFCRRVGVGADGSECFGDPHHYHGICILLSTDKGVPT